MSYLLSTGLCLLGLLGIMYILSKYTEGFLSSGDFPFSVDNPSLKNDYPVKKNPQLSTDTSEIMSKEQPRTPMSSYEQVTNNFRYWKNPNNGMCSPADFCNSIYNNKQIHVPTVPTPNDLSVRVNYYNIE